MSKTDKKNQHYIPKFYLRNFSFQSNKKQIGVFNIKSKFFFQKAKLKTQGSKNFFYGTDGVIEDKLSEIEGVLADVLKNIIDSRKLPKKEDVSYVYLLAFISITHLRNPVSINSVNRRMEIMKENLLELHPETDVDKLLPTIEHEEAVEISMSHVNHIINHIIDLECKLLINKTETPFITSDFPIVKYNQFLESKKWPHGRTGYGIRGLQIFVPIDNDLTLFFYDSTIYKAGNKKGHYHELKKDKDIDQLNLLQIINCDNNTFFSERIDTQYMEELHQKAEGVKSNHEVSAGLHNMIDSDGEFKEKSLMIVGTSETEIKLNIDGINYTPQAARVKLTDKVTQLRPLSKKLYEIQDMKDYL